MHSCSKCGWTFIEETKENTTKPKCPYCNSFDGVVSENVTMASEHHVCEMVKKENLTCAVAQNQTHIYRYNNSNKALDLNFLKSLKLGDVNLKSYTMDAVTEYKF
jgi:NAD-dependent SIR2 family protein deacetylase